MKGRNVHYTLLDSLLQTKVKLHCVTLRHLITVYRKRGDRNGGVYLCVCVCVLLSVR